jgi:hypothetical protein
MIISNDLMRWLMEGDPAIRWQTMRDLQNAPAKKWKAEQQRTLTEGWGARLLEQQAKDGSWGGGIYTPKWTSTTYTMLTLCDIGIPRDHQPAQKGAELMLTKLLGNKCDKNFKSRLARCDRCIVGMILEVASYFGIRDPRIDAIIENLLSEMIDDGAWNCRRGRDPKPPYHSSFHTTFNVLDGIREWLETSPKHKLRNVVRKAEKDALEFSLNHHLFKSHKTGKIIHDKFNRLSFPYRWHYDALRGLDYFARVNAPHDKRLKDAMELLQKNRSKDGTWPNQYKYSGKVYFDMEKVGRPSRWNTLRALRILKWWDIGVQI